MTALRPSLLLALCLAALLPACKKDAPAAAAKPTQAAGQAVSVAPATTRDIARSIQISGPVAAVEDMQLGVELSGLRVTALNVDVGQAVRRGQVLLTLDHRMLDAQLAQADANLKQAQAGASLARANYSRGQNLVQGKYISAMQLDELRAAQVQADAQMATARAARDTAALQRSFAQLRAPAAGIISKRLVQPGQVVGAGQTLLQLIKDGRLEWRAELPANQLGAVQPGDIVQLRTREGAAVEGRVRAVSPGVDAQTRTGTIYADLPKPEGLHPGAYLDGRIDTGRVQALVVPASAVVLRDGFPTVFTVQAGKAHAVRIQQGQRDGDHVQVLSGLPAGAQVVVDGAGFLGDGDAVRVVAPTPAGSAAPAAAPSTDTNS